MSSVSRVEAERGSEAAATAIERHLGPPTPRIALVLGSGLGALADRVRDAVRIPYGAIPGFPETGVAGHGSELVAGELGSKSVIVQRGRFHLYEGHAPFVVSLPVRTFHRLGVRILIVTNAAGGLRPTFQPGTLMLIADHLNLMWRSPLAGPVVPGEERFPDMSDPYDPALRLAARAAALRHHLALEEGVYAGLLGPSYETPAEIRMLARMGADAVGMSTVPEVIVARACGMRVLGFSVITNLAAGLSSQQLSHEEVLATGKRAATDLASLIEAIVRALDEGVLKRSDSAAPVLP